MAKHTVENKARIEQEWQESSQALLDDKNKKNTEYETAFVAMVSRCDKTMESEKAKALASLALPSCSTQVSEDNFSKYFGSNPFARCFFEKIFQKSFHKVIK